MCLDDDTRILVDSLDLDDDTLVDVHCWTGVDARREESTRMVDYAELVRILAAASR